MLSRKILLIMMSQGVGAILGLLSLPIFGRYIDKGDFGVVGAAMGMVGIFAFLADLGYSHAYVKRMTEGEDPNEITGTYIFTKFVLSGLLIVSIVISIFLWENILGFGYDDPETPLVIMIMMGHFLLIQLNSMFFYYFQAKKETAIQEFPIVISHVVRFGSLLVVAFMGLGVFALAGTFYISAAFACIIGAMFFSKRGPVLNRPRKDIFLSYSKFAIPLVLSNSMILIALNIDKVMINMFWASENVADYFMSQKVTMVILGLSAAVGALLFPSVSEAHSKGNMKEVKKLTTNAERYLAMVVFPVVVFLLIYPREIFHIVGDVYLTATTVLKLHSIYALIYVLFMVFIYQINGLNKPALSGKIILITSVLNISLNIVFIPDSLMGVPLGGLGAAGAALATVVSFFFGFLLARYQSHLLTGDSPEWRLLLHIVAAFVTSVVMLSLNFFFLPTRIYTLALYSIITLVVYLGVLTAFKEFHKRDIDFFLATLNPKEMIRYIREEFGNSK